MISFTVPGQPIPKARARTMKGYSFTPKRTRDAEKAVKVAARLALGPRKADTEALYSVSTAFHRLGQRRCDGDNLQKLVLDALSGIIWANDHQVRMSVWEVIYGSNEPRTVIRVCPYIMGPEKPYVSPYAHVGSC